jgi:hypothetical protein
MGSPVFLGEESPGVCFDERGETVEGLVMLV